MTANPHARLSIVAYRPKPGKEAELWTLTEEHVPLLRKLGMATDRPHVVGEGAGGVIVEVFEWTENGLERAHADPEVGKLWVRYMEACDFVPIRELEETAGPFANFVPRN